MIRAQMVSVVGQMTQAYPVGGHSPVGAIDAKPSIERDRIEARPARKRVCCKTCDGHGCVGRCKF
jgi:hypothetical protein